MRTLLVNSFLVLAVVGCGVGQGEGRSSAQPGQVLVTRDFGGERLGQETLASVPAGETVMRALTRRFDVKTRFGGGFVQSIEGLSSGSDAGRRVDWFFYVNGIESDEGASTYEVNPGDHVWWDHREWSAALRVPAVVGAFPQPFLGGVKGKRLPVRVDCARSAAGQCKLVLAALRRAGVPRASQAGFGQPVGLDTLRVLVGPWREIRTDGAAARLEVGPKLSGVYARFRGKGAALELLDAAGKPTRIVAQGAGLVAATRFEEQAATWFVTGVDAAGVEAAAGALEAGALGEHFALAVVRGRGVALPEAAKP